MGFKSRFVGAAVGGVVAFGLTMSVVQADAVSDRQGVMGDNGKAMKALAAMLKGEAEFDAAIVKATGTELAAQFKAAKALFPPGSETATGKKPSRAKPEIWQDKDSFLKIFDDAIVAAGAIGSATDLASLGPALMDLGKNGCTACHKKYQKPKE